MAETDLQSRVGDPVVYLAKSVWASARRPSNVRMRRALEPPITLTDCALHLVTDFIVEQPVTITKDRPIDEALRQMVVAGVRAMFVVQAEIVIGLITSYDIQGERPLQFLRASNYTRHDEIEVGHIMTPWERLLTLEWQVVRTARVADVERLFERRRATHLVLVETAAQGGTFVRGLISRTRLERQLGHSIR